MLSTTIAVVLFSVSAMSRYQIFHIPSTADGTKLTSSNVIVTPFLYTGFDSVSVTNELGALSALPTLLNSSLSTDKISTLNKNTLNTCSEFSKWADMVIEGTGSNATKSYTSTCNLVRAMWIVGAIALFAAWLILVVPVLWSSPILGRSIAASVGCMWLAIVLFAVHALVFMSILDDIAVQVTTDYDGTNDVIRATNELGATIFFLLLPTVVLSVIACNSFFSSQRNHKYETTNNPMYVSFVS